MPNAGSHEASDPADPPSHVADGKALRCWGRGPFLSSSRPPPRDFWGPMGKNQLGTEVAPCFEGLRTPWEMTTGIPGGLSNGT